MNILGLISQLIGIKTLRLTPFIQDYKPLLTSQIINNPHYIQQQ